MLSAYVNRLTLGKPLELPRRHTEPFCKRPQEIKSDTLAETNDMLKENERLIIGNDQ
jgi:hypothetical protein